MECIKNKYKYYQDHLFNASCFECNIGSKTYKKEYVIDCIIDEKMDEINRQFHKLYKQRDFIAKTNAEMSYTPTWSKCSICGVYTVGSDDNICEDCRRERNGY